MAPSTTEGIEISKEEYVSMFGDGIYKEHKCSVCGVTVSVEKDGLYGVTSLDGTKETEKLFCKKHYDECWKNK